MSNRKKIADAGYSDAIVFENPDYDEAIVGITECGNVVYDFSRMIKHLKRNYGMKNEQAIDFIESDTMRAAPFAKDRAPIIITMLKDLKE